MRNYEGPLHESLNKLIARENLFLIEQEQAQRIIDGFKVQREEAEARVTKAKTALEIERIKEERFKAMSYAKLKSCEKTLNQIAFQKGALDHGKEKLSTSETTLPQSGTPLPTPTTSSPFLAKQNYDQYWQHQLGYSMNEQGYPSFPPTTTSKDLLLSYQHPQTSKLQNEYDYQRNQLLGRKPEIAKEILTTAPSTTAETPTATGSNATATATSGEYERLMHEESQTKTPEPSSTLNHRPWTDHLPLPVKSSGEGTRKSQRVTARKCYAEIDEDERENEEEKGKRGRGRPAKGKKKKTYATTVLDPNKEIKIRITKTELEQCLAAATASFLSETNSNNNNNNQSSEEIDVCSDVTGFDRGNDKN